MADIKSLNYDVALATDPGVFAMLKDMVGASHMMFGTDYLLRRESGTAGSIKELADYSGLDEHERELIMSETAKTLFPRFR